MGKGSSIEWTEHTFNPWIGCTTISDGCDNCYARTWAARLRPEQPWNAPPVKTTLTYWKQPFQWNEEAKRENTRTRVFCASLADVFDNRADPAWRAQLWAAVSSTRNLHWIILTKRPQNIAGMLPIDWADGYPHVWLGVSAENQEEADRRIPILADTPARVRFLSCEPLLGPINIEPWLDRLHWVIAGGESGINARPMHPTWEAWLREQCAAGSVPYFFKQWGNWLPEGTLAGPHKLMTPDGKLHPEMSQALLRAGNCTPMYWATRKDTLGMVGGRQYREFPAP